MDQHSLLRLADEGLADFPPGRFSEAADWCWEWGAATGDARWCLLWRLLQDLAALFDEHEAVPAATVERVDRAMRLHLRTVLTAASPVDGCLAIGLLQAELSP